MAQDDSEIKIIPARAISRENQSRDVMADPPLLAPASTETEGLKIPRRGLFKSLIPLSGKALTDFLRTVSTPPEDPKQE
jgi:hypothetical protein